MKIWAAIPFFASDAAGNGVYGSILISVTTQAVPEVYALTQKNTSYNFPASSVYSAVQNATGSALAGIQLLSLGVVGEYIGKIYAETKQRPRFIIEQVLNNTEE